MKLEQQMYKISRVGKERIYTIGDLENLSATALYYGEGGGSSGFSGGIGGGGFGGIGKKECNKYGIVRTPLMESSESLHQDFSGSCWSKSFGLSTDYIKIIPQGELHIHAPKGFITGANLNGDSLSNYDACMLDLQIGKIIKDNKKW